MKGLFLLFSGIFILTSLSYSHTEDMNYKLVFFELDEYASPKVIERKIKTKIKTKQVMKKEDRIKLILNDLLSYPTDVLKTKGLFRPIKAKVEVLDVKTATTTKKLAPDITITHREVHIELSRNIIPYLTDETVEMLGTQICKTLEHSGYDFTAFYLKVRDKKGILRPLIHFVDNPE